MNEPYRITNYSRKQAKRLNVTIRRSTNPKKKLDVFSTDHNNQTRKIASIGAKGYGDYPTFMRTEGMKSAKKHRKQYKRRHEKDRHRIGSPGFYADQILW
jgi:hypothetical protein